MQHKKLWLHQVVLILGLAFLSAQRLLTGTWEFDFYFLWWSLGAVIGFGFVFLDRLFHIFMADERDPFAKFIRGLLDRKQYAAALNMLLSDRQAPQHLFMRSALFLAVWVLIGLLAMTSSASAFGRGFVLGMGLHLAFDLLTDYFGKTRDVDLWFWQIKRKLEPQEITAVVWGFIILFLVIAWFL